MIDSDKTLFLTHKFKMFKKKKHEALLNASDIMTYMLDNFNKIKMFNHVLISKYTLHDLFRQRNIIVLKPFVLYLVLPRKFIIYFKQYCRLLATKL